MRVISSVSGRTSTQLDSCSGTISCRWLVGTGAWEQQIYSVIPSTSHAAHSSPHKCIKSPLKLLATLIYSVTTTSLQPKQLTPPPLWKLLATLNNSYRKLPGKMKNTRLLAGIEGKCKSQGWCNGTQIWYTARICRWQNLLHKALLLVP